MENLESNKDLENLELLSNLNLDTDNINESNLKESAKKLENIIEINKDALNSLDLEKQNEILSQIKKQSDSMEGSLETLKTQITKRDELMNEYYTNVHDKVKTFTDTDFSQIQTALVLDIIKVMASILKENNHNGLELLYGSYEDRIQVILTWVVNNRLNKNLVTLKEISNLIFALLQNQVDVYSDIDLDKFLTEFNINDVAKQELRQILSYTLHPDLSFMKAFEYVVDYVVSGFIYNEETQRYESIGNNKQFLVLLSRLTKISVEEIENLDANSLYSLTQYVLLNLQKAKVAYFFQKSIRAMYQIK